jgi:hypothetical protein
MPRIDSRSELKDYLRRSGSAHEIVGEDAKAPRELISKKFDWLYAEALPGGE